MKLSRAEIETRLENVPSDVRVALALRSALRVLPLLAVQGNVTENKEAFWFWQQADKSRYLLALFKAYSISIEFIFTGNYHAAAASSASDMSYAAASSAANSAYNHSATTSNAAVLAVSIANVVDTAVTASHVAYAAYSTLNTVINTATSANAAYAAYAAPTKITYAQTTATVVAAATTASHNAFNTIHASIHAAQTAAIAYIAQEIAFDLILSSNADALALLQRPLWSHTIEADFLQLYERFRNQVLELNTGFEVWLSWYDDRLYGRAINQQLLARWNNIANENALEVNAYLANLASNITMQSLNRARVMFIGYNGSGKTSLIHALFNEPVLEDKSLNTQGLVIREWRLPNSEIKASFWDFGGSLIEHNSYQLFFRASCVYVVVLSAHNDMDSTQQAEYWLESIKSFTKNAPVMLVWNKADQASMDIDVDYLKEKYSNINNFYSLSCTRARTGFQAKFELFKNDFCTQLQQTAQHQLLFTQEQFNTIESLRYYLIKTTFLNKQQFEDICTDQGVANTGVQNSAWLLDILDNLGLVIYFPKASGLDNYIFNPQWLSHGIYSVLYNKRARLTHEEIINLLSKTQVENEVGYLLNYPRVKCHFIIEAMQAFKLCYSPLVMPPIIIIPALLAIEQPHFVFDKTKALLLEFCFNGFFPHYIIHQLITLYYQDVLDMTHWQQGALLKPAHYNAQALIMVNYHQNTLSIWTNGEQARDYLAMLQHSVLKLLTAIVLDYKEWIALPKQACISNTHLLKQQEKASYRQLIATIKEGKRDFISEQGLRYSIERLSSLLFTNELLAKEGIVLKTD